MTLADMILAHDLIEQIGMDLALELLDVIDGETLLRPELASAAQRAVKLLDHEFGDEVQATGQVRAVLHHSLRGLQA